MRHCVYSIALTGEDLDEAIRLMELLRSELRNAIEATLAPNEADPREEIDREHVAQDRRDRRSAAKLLKVLKEARRV